MFNLKRLPSKKKWILPKAQPYQPKVILASVNDILSAQDLVLRVPVADTSFLMQCSLFLLHVLKKILLDFIKNGRMGAGPRAFNTLLFGAKAKALLDGRSSPEVLIFVILYLL